MSRYLRLYLHFLRFSFSRALMFRLDFFFRVAMDACFYAVHLAFFGILYRHTALLGGWTLDQALVFLAGYFCMDALHMTLFANNMWWFPFLVNKGDLDYYLVRPVSSLFFVSLREFAANSFLNLVMAAGILAWALGRLPEVDPLRLLLFLGLLANGCLLYWIVQMLFLIPVFWLHSDRGLGEVFFSCMNCVSRPDMIYTGWARRVLVSVLPFALMASFPARALFEGPTPALLLHVTGVTAAGFLLVVCFWKLGLRAYASASS